MVSANPCPRHLPAVLPGTNTFRSLFLEPEMRHFYRNWDKLTEWAVSWVRAYAGHHPDPALAAVIDELLEESARFRLLWSRHDVRHDDRGMVKMTHPPVGPLDLHFQHMILYRSGHVLVVYWAGPGSASECALRQLSGRQGSAKGQRPADT